MTDITVRNMRFEFPDGIDPVFVKDDPQTSFTFLGSWMMLPYLEPYLIRSINAAIEKIDDPALKEEARRFCAQEGHHFRQHAKANKVIRALRPEYAKLAEIEAELDAEYKRFTKEKSLRFNLAYAEGFEAMTTAMSRTQMEVGMFEEVDSPLAQLALWHITEELEHRTVAYDVYEHVCGGYFYRLVAGIWAQYHFIKYTLRFAKVMTEGDPDTMRKHDTPANRKRLAGKNLRFLAKALPRVLAIYMPWYSPRKVGMPANFDAIRDRLTTSAVSAT